MGKLAIEMMAYPEVMQKQIDKDLNSLHLSSAVSPACRLGQQADQEEEADAGYLTPAPGTAGCRMARGAVAAVGG